MSHPNFISDETSVSEITIQPDGRLFVFGASEGLLRLLAELGWADDGLQRRLNSLSLRCLEGQDSVHETPLAGQSSVALEGSSE
jgi:hypothetical protein